MKHATTLALHETPRQASFSHDQPLPFDIFLRHVAELTAAGAGTDLAGAAVWGGFPIEDAMIDGLWPLMKKIATVIGRQLSTEASAVDLANIIENYVSIGISIFYPSLKDAAIAFRDAVIVQARTALRRIGKPVPPASVWAENAARFFARLVKNVRLEAAQLYEASTGMREHNINPILNNAPIVMFDDTESDFLYTLSKNVGEILRTGRAYFVTDAETVSASIRRFRKAQWECAENLPLLQLLRRLPYVGMPSQISTKHTSIIEQWVNTQIHLVSAALPDRDYLKLSELLLVAQATETLDPELVADGVVARMKKRGWRPAVGDVEAIRSLVIERASSQKDIPFNKIGTTVLMYLLHDRLPVGIDATEEVDEPESPIQEYADRGGDVRKNIRWEAITIAQLERLLDTTELLDTEDVIRGIARMAPELQADAVKRLETRDLIYPPDHDPLMCRLGLKELTFKTLIGDRTLIQDAKPSSELFSRLFGELGDETNENAEAYPIMCDLLNEAPAALVRQMARNPDFRPQLANFVFGITDTDSNTGLYVLESAVSRLRKTVGESFWARSILQFEVSVRADIYAGVVQTKQPIPTWVDHPVTEEEARPWKGHLFPIGGPRRLTPSAAKKALKKYSEEDLVRWTNEYDDRKRNEAFVAKLIADRTAYFAAHPAPTTPAPASKKRTRTKRPRS